MPSVCTPGHGQTHEWPMAVMATTSPQQSGMLRGCRWTCVRPLLSCWARHQLRWEGVTYRTSAYSGGDPGSTANHCI